MLPASITAQIFPSEILLLIGTILEYENQRETLSSLARTSRTAWNTLTPLLFQNVTLPYRNSLAGVISNFGLHRSSIHPPITDFEIGKARGLQLLRMIRELTLEAVPRVDKINRWRFPDSSVWHELCILTYHHSVLTSHKRLKKFTITGSAIQQLQLADPVAELSELGYDRVIMPSDGVPPPSDNFEFTFLPQSGFTLATLISFYQPLHLIIQYPLTWYQHPQSDPAVPHNPSLPKEIRPHEIILMNAFRGLRGSESTLCVHDLHDQCPPIGHIGAQHHISFTAFPSVPILFVTPRSTLPYVSLHMREMQIKRIIRKANPIIPDVTTCTNMFHQPVTLEQWRASTGGRWTIYRVGAMIAVDMYRDEWFHGANIEGHIRTWVEKEFTEEEGHPAGLADSINARLRFVHGGEDDDPDDLICEACGHECRIPVE